MAFPTDIGVIDLMLDLPSEDQSDWYEFLKPQLREESRDYEFPAQYMFKDVPHLEGGPDPVATTLHLMDRHNIERAMIGVGFSEERATKQRALRDHPNRFIGSFSVDPNRGMDGVRDLVKAYETLGITPKPIPMRGGYDGAVLSQKGLPCPNLFTGAHNFHSIYEYLPVKSLEAASAVVIEIIKLTHARFSR